MSIRIETDRLIIRTPVMDDLAVIHAAKLEVWHDLQLWMSWAYDGFETIEATQNFIEHAPSKNFLIGICRDSGKFVISTGINPREDHDDQLETGYWVAKDFLGKGYATESTNAVIRYGFEVLGAPAIYISHYEGNGPSRRVIEKLGFTKTGLREDKHARCLDGTLLDVHEYIMRDKNTLPPLDVRW